MKTREFKHLVAGIAVMMIFALPLVAEEHSDSGTRPLSGGEQKVLNKMVDDFIDVAGEKTQELVEALRTGNDLSYVIEVEQTVLDDLGNPVMVEVENGDGTVMQVEKTERVEQTVVVENTLGPMGIGNVKLALGLVKATIPEDADYRDVIIALLDNDAGKGILDMRADGQGWGEIYKAYDMKVGDIMRAKDAARSGRIAKMNRRIKLDKPERPERPEKPEKPERPGKPEKPEKPQKPEKPLRPGRG